MSNRNNDVFQVLVTKGNQAVLAAGADISNLAVGQIGAFDPNTGLSIGAATSPMPRELYLAVGVDKSGSGTLEDIRTSAGQMIQKKGITSYTFRAHSAGRPMIAKVGGYGVVADTDYGIRVEFRNSKISSIQGQNQFSKAFVVRTGVDTVDSNVLTQLLVAEIALDGNVMLIAKPVARQAIVNLTTPVNAAFTAGAGTLAAGTYHYRVSAVNAIGETLASTETSFAAALNTGVNVNWAAVAGATGYKIYGRSIGAGLLIATVGNVTTYLDNGSITPAGALPTSNTATYGTSVAYAPGAVMTDADINVLIAFNKTAIDANKVYTDLTLQSVPVPVGANFQTNLGFHKFVQTTLVTSLIEGFTSVAKVTVAQELAYEEGSGTNIKHKEYHSSTYNGSGPYVLSETTGMAKGDILYLAVDGTKYDQIALEYTQKSESGWLEYENTLSTFIAIPETETVTRNSVATLLDAIVAGGAFEPLADDAAAANVGPTVVEANPTSTAVDGLA